MFSLKYFSTPGFGAGTANMAGDDPFWQGCVVCHSDEITSNFGQVMSLYEISGADAL